MLSLKRHEGFYVNSSLTNWSSHHTEQLQ